MKVEEKQKFLFLIKNTILTSLSLAEHLKLNNMPIEDFLEIEYKIEVYSPSKIINRCASTMLGHRESILTIAFSPNGDKLCSGSGDATIRFWNIHTATCNRVGKGLHSDWILSISWSPDGAYVSSGGKDSLICVWDGHLNTHISSLIGHKSWITSLSWEPCHLAYPCRRIASGSKDCCLRIWDILTQKCIFSLVSHTQAIRSVRWGGEGLIYSASADGSVKVWSSTQGQLKFSLEAHSHWVNTLSLSTDYVLRTGPYECRYSCNLEENTPSVKKAVAEKRYFEFTLGHHERLVSGSDDLTMFLWTVKEGKDPKSLMTGHQQPINFVSFSPNGIWLVSTSFDKSIKLWNGMTGQLVTTFRGHSAAVYSCSWSPDSKHIISASKDNTLKVWDIEHKTMLRDFYGHSDEIFVVDWNPNGSIVASGGRDKTLMIWKN
jgi:ribosome assembly protein 4